MATKKFRSVTPLIVTAPPRQRFAYETDASGSSRRTDARRVDDAGQPLSAITGFGYLYGGPESITVLAPDAVLADVEVGSVVIPQGSRMTLSERGGDYGAIIRTIGGVEALALVMEDAEPLFDQMTRGK